MENKRCETHIAHIRLPAHNPTTFAFTERRSSSQRAVALTKVALERVLTHLRPYEMVNMMRRRKCWRSPREAPKVLEDHYRLQRGVVEGWLVRVAFCLKKSLKTHISVRHIAASPLYSVAVNEWSVEN